MYAALLLVFVQIVCGAHGPGGYNICLSCPRVSHPRECQTFVEKWPEERCYTQMLLLMNGSRAYEFGHAPASSCGQSDHQQSSLDRGRRQILITDIVLCYECCSESLCNHRLCGIHEINSTNLACLLGEESDGLPNDTSITYCNEGEYCYAGRTPLTRPHTQNYGCAQQVVCDHLPRVSAGSSTMCQRCCSEDGCNAHICHEQVQESTTSTIDTTQRRPSGPFTDCWDMRTRGGYQRTGLYDIYPPPANSRLRVRCDMTTDGGGWTVLQRRFDGSVNFTRTFQQYEDGFGYISSEHWLGLRWMNVLMSQGAVQMRVDLCRFDGQAGYAVYDGFNVSGPGDNYTLHTGVYRTGSMRDELRRHDGREFQVTGLCADRYIGGWWYHRFCISANLNGGRYNGGSSHGIMWGLFGGHGSYPNVRSSELKIRPLNAPGDPTHPYTCPP